MAYTGITKNKYICNMEQKNSCVYIHIKETNGEPFYIGKGSKDRAFSMSEKKRNKKWVEVSREFGCDVILLAENITDSEASEIETYWINRLGRLDLGTGTLVNMTDGASTGESGRVFTDEHKKNMSLSRIGNMPTPWNKGKTGLQVAWNKGKKSTDTMGKSTKVINTETGEVFNQIKQAAESIGMKPSTLAAKLRGQNKNNTKFKYI